MNDWQKSVVLDYETVAVTNMRDRDWGEWGDCEVSEHGQDDDRMD